MPSFLLSLLPFVQIVTMQSYGRMLLDARRGIANIQAGIAGVSGGDITDSSDGSSTGSTGGSSTSGRVMYV